MFRAVMQWNDVKDIEMMKQMAASDVFSYKSGVVAESVVKSGKILQQF